MLLAPTSGHGTYKHELPFADGQMLAGLATLVANVGPTAREVDVRTPRQHSDSSRSFLVVSATGSPREAWPLTREKDTWVHAGSPWKSFVNARHYRARTALGQVGFQPSRRASMHVARCSTLHRFHYQR